MVLFTRGAEEQWSPLYSRLFCGRRLRVEGPRHPWCPSEGESVLGIWIHSLILVQLPPPSGYWHSKNPSSLSFDVHTHRPPPPPAANNFLCPPWGSCIPFEGSQTTPASNCETNPIHLWKVGAAPVLLLLGVERSAASSVVRRLSCTVEKGAHPAHTWAPDTVAGVAQKSEAIRCLFSCSFLGSWGWQGTDNGSNDSDALQVVDPQQWGWGWPWVWWGRLSRGSAETFL